jgi:hypothetical protein
LFALAACGARPLIPRDVPSPAAPGSAEPCIEVGGDGVAYLSWLEPAGGGHALKFSRWEGSAWSQPRTIAEGADWFVNWADFPAVTALADGTIAAHWLRKTGGGPYAYAVTMTLSRDGGATWSAPVTPHDASPTEHGFVSMAGLDGNRLAAIWLDGRETGGDADHPAGPMHLRGAVLAADGRIEREDLIDGRACECCQTSAVRLDDGSIVAVYRDRSEGEIRDVAVVRFDGSRWSEPRTVHDDGWEMPGCPVNGPAVAARGSLVAVAWFTAAGAPPQPKVKIAFSRDGGRSFASPSVVSAAAPEGRVDIVALEDSALVTWIEGGGEPKILARRAGPDGALGETLTIATSSVARAAGFPRMAALGDDVLIAWTQPGSPSQVKTARLSSR